MKKTFEWPFCKRWQQQLCRWSAFFRGVGGGRRRGGGGGGEPHYDLLLFSSTDRAAVAPDSLAPFLTHRLVPHSSFKLPPPPPPPPLPPPLATAPPPPRLFCLLISFNCRFTSIKLLSLHFDCWCHSLLSFELHFMKLLGDPELDVRSFVNLSFFRFIIQLPPSSFSSSSSKDSC